MAAGAMACCPATPGNATVCQQGTLHALLAGHYDGEGFERQSAPQMLTSFVKMGSDKVALVSGCSGVQGRALLKRLDASNDWKEVVAISRRPIDFDTKARVISCDLQDRNATKNTLQKEDVKHVTHLFHLAFAGDTTNRDMAVANMLFTMIEALEAVGSPLEHVFFAEGDKWYGIHLGGSKTPFRESDPRHLPPQYYYAMEDYVMARKKQGAKWNWSTYRPGPIIGYSLGTMNWLMEIAVYATICKEEGLSFRFPGSPAGYNNLFDCADANLLADCQIFLATHWRAQNQAFNVNNGDVFRFSELWPKLASWFGLELGPPLRVPMAAYMPFHKAAWENIVNRHSLKDIPYERLVRWEFMDATLGADYDQFQDTVKLRKAGFNGMKLYTDEVFFSWFEQLAADKIIPNYPQLRKKAKMAKPQALQPEE